MDVAPDINMSEIKDLHRNKIREIPDVQIVRNVTPINVPVVPVIPPTKPLTKPAKPMKRLTIMEKIATIAAINNGVNSIPSLEMIFEDVEYEEFVRGINLNPHSKRDVATNCKICEINRPFPNKFCMNMCLQCVYEQIHKIRDCCDNIKILCRAVITDKPPKDEFIRERIAPTFAKFAPCNTIIVGNKSYTYRAYLPEIHPFNRNGAKLPDGFAKFILDIEDYKMYGKPVEGYFTIRILGNYFCTNFIMGKMCYSVETGQSDSKIVNVGMTDISTISDERQIYSKKYILKNKCRSCSNAKHDARYRYGIA
jgi:hypothetical protein